MKRSIIVVVLACGALAFAAAGSAHPTLGHAKHAAKSYQAKGDDPTPTEPAPADPKEKKVGAHGPPVHPRSDVYGPYSVTSTDNGCAGTPWATDTLSRTFVVKRAKATPGATTGNWRVWRYDRGTFTTTAGTSPGNCTANTTPHGSTVAAGKTGKVHGYLAGVVSGGTYDPAATCTDATCGTTDGFIAAHFGPAAHYSCFETSTQCKFDFAYSAPGQHLAYHHWRDRGTGAGDSLNETFAGDIADGTTDDGDTTD